MATLYRSLRVYGRLGDEDFVGNVLRLSGRPYASEGIPCGLPELKILA